MTTLVRYLLGSGIAGAMTLWSTAACAYHDTATATMLLGHGTLVPAYASIIYYAVNSHKRMPVGWAIPNVVNALRAGSVGGLATVALVETPELQAGPYGPPATAATVSVFAGSIVVLGASIVQASRTRTKNGPVIVRETAALPVLVLPTASVTREHGTMFGLAATGVF